MNTATKKIIGFLTLLIYMAILSPVVVANEAALPGQKRKFLVTGYYSPLPNQSFYVRGSYEADIRLNGRGTNGADGTEVYVGMLAAPKSYPFGTRIHIPGLGVGEVHDRGGAIFAGADYDRIDVWMGHGEEGLARALNWGARIVEGEIFWKAHQVEPGLSFNWIDSDLPQSAINRMKPKTLQNPEVFKNPITKQSNTNDIKELQEALTTFGYYHGDVTGIYDQATTDAVLAFQLVEGVIPNENTAGAGNFGPLTRAKLKEVLENFNAEVIKEQKRLEYNRSLLNAGLGKTAEGEDVVALQRMLWELGYYKGQLNGEYNSQTIDAVYDFQIAYGILDNEWDLGAGFYGNQTHKALSQAVNRKIQQVAEYPMEKQVWVPAKVELPKIASLEVPKVSMERQSLSFSPELMTNDVDPEPSEILLSELDLYDKNTEVVKLQNILIKNGYLTAGLNTGYYGRQTESAVLKFQMEKGIVSSESSLGAGRVGPKTRKALNSL